jgi:ubiquinone/menaquinone biosynthesis C-methylase UbiE
MHVTDGRCVSAKDVDMTENLREQYAIDENLRARIALHAAFSLNPHWAVWLFEREAPGPGARILDRGCGPATFWRTNREWVDPTWSLTLADFSPGMIEAARRELGERAVYVVADAQELPFPADSFGAVLANHMLYHVPDRSRAFREIRRVLVSGGAFHASTVGRGHLAELEALVPGWTSGATPRPSDWKPGRNSFSRSSPTCASSGSRMAWP